jgi:excisionase family DNA binding protein
MQARKQTRATSERKPLLTVVETAAVMGIGKNRAYDAVREGQIPSIKVGKQRMVCRAALEKLLNEGVTV